MIEEYTSDNGIPVIRPKEPNIVVDMTIDELMKTITEKQQRCTQTSSDD